MSKSGGNTYDQSLFNWLDITSDFKQACNELDLGELVHDDLFGLYEAMSAIEMMDPKMDLGMLCNGNEKRSQSLTDAIQSGEIRVKGLTWSELIGVVDVSFAYLVSWLEGHSLLQTVCTSVFLQQPTLLVDPVLRSFCTALVHLVNTISLLASQQGSALLKEEDFQSLTIADNTGVSARCAVSMLREEEEQLLTTISQSSSKTNSDIIEALLSRIKFTRILLQTVLVVATAGQVICSQQQQLSAVKDSWESLEEALPAVQLAARTVHLGAYHQQLEVASQGGHLDVMGFDPLLNRRQLPPAFPRYPCLRSVTGVYSQLTHIVQQLLSVKSVFGCRILHSLMNFLEKFSARSPGVLLRLVLYTVAAPLHCLDINTFPTLTGPNSDSWSLVVQATATGGESSTLPSNGIQTLVRAAKKFIAPPSFTPTVLNKLSEQDREALDRLFSRCRRVFYNVLLVSGHNRARQRQKLKAAFLSLASLSEEADRVDAQLHDLCQSLQPARRHIGCLSSWVQYHQLRCMIEYQLAGFELQLYSQHEYHYIYWYLSECLYRWKISVLARAESFLLEAATLTPGGSGAGGQDGPASGRTAKHNRNARSSMRKLKPCHEAEILHTHALQNLCAGLHKVCVGLDMQNRIRRSSTSMNNESVRYVHRLAPFATISTPPFVRYDDYLRLSGLDTTRDHSEAYSSACYLFQQARSFLEALPSTDSEVVALTRIAKTNYVVTKILHDAKDSSVDTQFDFTVHQSTALLRIQ